LFSYYGSKSKIVDLYPSPKFDKIIEPFAGSAQYSLKWFDRDILLVDKYQVIVDVWHYLQQASEADIMGLPKLRKKEEIPNTLSKEEKMFMGFLVVGGAAQPQKKVTSFDGVNVAKDLRRISKELYKIRHWIIKQGDYRDIENQEATWFIDPPYQFGGELYKESRIDFVHLANWCKSRLGQVVVCENTKATWLDFYPMRQMSGQVHTTTEAIWSNYPHNFQARQPSLFETELES